MSTTWFAASRGGADVGFAAYHSTSDTWFPYIVEKKGALPPSGAKHDCDCGGTSADVELRSGDDEDAEKFVMPACLACGVLLGPLGSDSGY